MKILLIRLRRIGDVVFTTPAVRALKRRWPDARLSYVVEPSAAPIIADNPHLDAVIVAPTGGGLRRLRQDLDLGRRLGRERFDVVIDFHGGPRATWLTWATRAPTRIGYAIAYRSWVYTHRVERPRALRARHSVRNQWDLLAAVDSGFLKGPDPAIDAVEMAEDPAAGRRVERWLASMSVRSTDRVIVVHVSAGNRFRRWPAEFFADLLSGLAARDPLRRIIVTAGPSEADAARRVRAAAEPVLGQAGRIVESDALDLPMLRALLGRAGLFIGGDSGPLHVAATTRIPIVGIYGPTLSARSAPWRDPRCATHSVELDDLPCRPCDQRTCEPGDFRCLGRLSPQRVLEAAEQALRPASCPAP